MADFYSFEHFDEPILSYGDDSLQPRGNPRKNQSLSTADTEYLREAMRRLVPSNYVYGGSGIGERSYELFGLCISHALSGTRPCHLFAAICVMHATYERNSDLVITPEDIEAAYKPLKVRQIRVHVIRKVYKFICDNLKLPQLEVSSEKLFCRVFRDCCDLPESEVLSFTQTAQRFETEIRASLPPPRTDHLWTSKSGEVKGSSRCQVKSITVVALAAVFTLRFHKFTDVTTKKVLDELHVSAGAFFPLARRFKDTSGQQPSSEPVPREPTSADETDDFGIPQNLVSRRSITPKAVPTRIGNEVIPSGYTLRPQDRVEHKREYIKEEIMRIAPIADDDHLALLYLDDSPPLQALPPPPEPFPTSPSKPPAKRQKVKNVEKVVPIETNTPPQNEELDLLFAT